MTRRLVTSPGSIKIHGPGSPMFFPEWREHLVAAGKITGFNFAEINRHAVVDYPDIGAAEAVRLWLCKTVFEAGRNQGIDDVVAAAKGTKLGHKVSIRWPDWQKQKKPATD